MTKYFSIFHAQTIVFVRSKKACPLFFLYSLLSISLLHDSYRVDIYKFQSSEAWEQAVVICLCVAFAIESVTLVWSIITVVCSPLDTKGASAVLPFLTFLASILVMFAATLYTVKKDTKIGIL